MSASLSVTPVQQFLSDDGLPLAGCLLYTYAAGTNDPKVSYTDYSAAYPQTNPIIADAGGRMEIWLGTGSYKLALYDAQSNLIWMVDDVASGSSGPTAAYIVDTVIGATNSVKALGESQAGLIVAKGYRTVSDGAGGSFRWQDSATGGDDGETIDGNTAYTTGRYKRIIEGQIDPKWWGCFGSGTDDDKAYMDKAVWYARSVQKGITLTEGTYLLSSDTTFTGVPITFESNAVFTWTNFKPEMDIILPNGDYSQHFQISSDYVPSFQAGTQITPHIFGVLLDGTSSTSAAINSSILSVSDKGGKVYVPNGIWPIAEAVKPESNVLLYGEGTLTPLDSFVDEALISNTDEISNFRVTGLTLQGTSDASSAGILMSGSNVKMDHLTIQNFQTSGIIINNAFDASNISIEDNAIIDVAQAAVNNGHGIIINDGRTVNVERNAIISTNGKCHGAILAPENPHRNLYDLTIRGNSITGCTIYLAPTTANELKNVIVEDNNITNKNITLGFQGGVAINPDEIQNDTPASILGDCIIRNNIINLDPTGISNESVGIYAAVTNDAATDYVIADNIITGIGAGTSDSYGIMYKGTTKPMTIYGNTITHFDTAIHEISGVSDATYGTNLFHHNGADYAVADGRVCTLGDMFHSVIGGGTTCDSYMTIAGDLNLSGDFINTDYQQLQSDVASVISNAAPGTLSGGYFRSAFSGFGNEAGVDEGTYRYCYNSYKLEVTSLAMYAYGTWYGGDLKATLNGTVYTQSFITDSTTSLIALAAVFSSNDDVQSSAYYPTPQNSIVLVPKPGKVLDCMMDTASLIVPSTLSFKKTTSKNVNLSFTKVYGSENNFAKTLKTDDPIPAALIPTSSVEHAIPVYAEADSKNYASGLGKCVLGSDGIISFSILSGGFQPSWRGVSGKKGFPSFIMGYSLDSTSAGSI